MAQTGARSRSALVAAWSVLGLVMVGVPVRLLVTEADAVLAGHPALLVAAGVSALGGLLALAWCGATLVAGARVDREADPASHALRPEAELRSRSRHRLEAAVPTLLVCLALVVLVGSARPVPPTPGALAALRATDVRFADRLTWYELWPVAEEAGEAVRPSTALVFLPARRVDPRAYGAVLRPVAAAGYLVVVLKEPFGNARFDPGHAGRLLELHPTVSLWAVAGHAGGGRVATAAAADLPQVKALGRYGAPVDEPLERTDLAVLDLPLAADPGSVPAAGRDAVAAATTVWLASLTPPPPPPKKR